VNFGGFRVISFYFLKSDLFRPIIPTLKPLFLFIVITYWSML